jgi:hypothetical protein
LLGEPARKSHQEPTTNSINYSSLDETQPSPWFNDTLRSVVEDVFVRHAELK